MVELIYDLTGDINIVGDQGFLTSDKRFVNRKETAQIAHYEDELYSEDLFSKKLFE